MRLRPRLPLSARNECWSGSDPCLCVNSVAGRGGEAASAADEKVRRYSYGKDVPSSGLRKQQAYGS